MKTKFLLAGIVAVGMMASCANDGAIQTKKAEPATITIALKGNSETTKTAADLNKDGQINRIAVGLFDADNNLVSITEPAFTVSSSSGNLTANVTGTTLVTKVAAVANAPAGAFSSVKTLDAFHKVAIDISNTSTSDGGTTADGTKQYESDLPMEGDGTVTDASTGTGAATFSLTRLVSKIELDDITVAFDANGAYSNSKFVPTDIFMYNAAETTYANYASPYVADPTLLQGQDGSTGVTTYLGSGPLSLTQATSYPTVYTFFTMPIMPSKNTNTTSKTKLIIEGTFTDNSGATSTVYYPIIINHVMAGTYSDAGTTTAYTQQGTEDGLIAPNTYYKLMATIKTKGVSNVTDELTSAAITLTVTVNPWPTALTQNVVFN